LTRRLASSASPWPPYSQRNNQISAWIRTYSIIENRTRSREINISKKEKGTYIKPSTRRCGFMALACTAAEEPTQPPPYCQR
jgi:hypothetical protein